MESMELEGTEEVLVDAARSRLLVRFARTRYPIGAIYSAAYIFIDRCFVLLDAPDEDNLVLRLDGRSELSAAALKELAEEFGNELVSQTWRHEITEHNQPLIDAVTAQALSGTAEPAPDLDELDDMDFSDETFDDPLGIAMSWEQTHGKDTAAPVEGAPKGPPPAGGDSEAE